MNTQAQVAKNAKGGRRRKAVPDLNVPAPNEIHEQAGGTTIPAIPVAATGSTQPPLIDVEELDDDVIISSPRAFEEAKNKSRRIRRRPLVVDVESEEVTARVVHNHNHVNKKKRVNNGNAPIINCEIYNLEGSSGSMQMKRSKPTPPPPPPPPPPPEPTFTCPVCMGPLVQEVTTKCGHIFCKGCIQAAIKAQAKCPTCRRKVTNKDIIRVYLPTTK